MNRAHRSFRAPLVALAAALLLVDVNGGCMDGGELQCEEAAARLAECCHLDDVSAISCTHTKSSCGETFPEIGIDESRCIRNASCEELETLGACAWAAQSGPPTALPEVCR